MKEHGTRNRDAVSCELATSPPETVKDTTAVRTELERRFKRYQCCNLRSIVPNEFARHIQATIGKIDAGIEGYSGSELDRQRDLSVKFHWGHNHDFGDFYLGGRMGNRHINVMANFLTLFPLTLEDFNNIDVLDVGCWTGGTTLLLAALGSRVFAIEEVKKYARMTSFLLRSFGLENQATVEARSVYNCNSEEYFDRFRVVYFPGVIYHLSDPVLALRNLFNSLKCGGSILVESAGIESEEAICRFDGSLVTDCGTKDKLSRGGWNWFVPSALALHRMMSEAGFVEVKTLWHPKVKRVYGHGIKASQVGICKAGLSDTSIK